MTMISVERELLFDLVDAKLRSLQDQINQMLEKWHYNSYEKFLNDSKIGFLEEAEDDAICLKNLIDKREELLKNKWKWNEK